MVSDKTTPILLLKKRFITTSYIILNFCYTYIQSFNKFILLYYIQTPLFFQSLYFFHLLKKMKKLPKSTFSSFYSTNLTLIVRLTLIFYIHNQNLLPSQRRLDFLAFQATEHILPILFSLSENGDQHIHSSILL